MDVKIEYDLQVEALSVLISNNVKSPVRKRAAYLLLRTVFPKQTIVDMMHEAGCYFVYDRNCSEVRKWAKTVLSKGKCEICGGAERLEAHHVFGWAEYPLERVNPNNGMCLCHKCHTKMHEGEHVHAMMAATL
ncbi:MAG: HNH endonuclease [Bilifractor sp.]|jgi:hypothetical protein